MPDERALPDGALVVRGGLMRPGSVLASALDAAELTGVASISVFAADAEYATLDDLLGDTYIPHESIRVSTVRRVRTEGFTIRRTGRYPHCSVELGTEPSLEIARTLAGAFDPPQPNPGLRHHP